MIDLFIGIDPGSINCALVAFSPTRGIVDEHKPKPPREISGVQRLSFLMQDIKSWLDGINKLGTVKHICLEGYAPNMEFGREACGEVGATIKLTLVGWYGLHEVTAYPTVVPPPSLKKFIIGKGSGKGTGKSDMKLHTFKRWGVEFLDDNLCDAYGLARVAYAVEVPGVAVTDFQRDVIANLKAHTGWNPWVLNPPKKSTPQKKEAPRGRITPSSSKSDQPETPEKSLGVLPTRSKKVVRFASAPSAPRRSIKR